MFMDQDLQLCDDTPRELQDAAAVPKASPKRRAAKAKAEGKAAKGKREARATTGSAPCLADGCSDPRVSNTKWCKSHKRSYDAMLYQATKEEEQHPGTLEIFKTTMANDYNASMEVAQFAEENPPDKMYAKKKIHRLGPFPHRVWKDHQQHRQEQDQADVEGTVLALGKEHHGFGR